GFFPNGLKGFLFSLIIVVYAYLGIEIVAVAAGESHNPDTTLPSAIDKVIYRIILFYALAMIVILSIYPFYTKTSIYNYNKCCYNRRFVCMVTYTYYAYEI
ncbi:MAG TPA: amino acid permease, partial [Desulfurella acetivorans]|nr:amino acid permease [Desulfurella acetivorans]